METVERQPAAPLDEEPALYRGLGMTALLRTLIGALVVWLIPAAVAAGILGDGQAAVMLFISFVLVVTSLTTVIVARVARRFKRGRPKNWVNRALASKLKLTRINLVTQHYWSR